MAVPLAMKRMCRERKELEKPNPDYFVCFENDNLLHFDAYIIGPPDSVYHHKLIKVHFDLPHNYPMVPPVCKFIQHSSRGRIHPNLYVDGKICLSILGTWPGEPWAQAMKIDSVLITIRSLLDNSPFRHEPWGADPRGRDDPDYNAYVRYASWDILLLDYLVGERSLEMRLFLHHFLRHNGPSMMAELRAQSCERRLRDRYVNRYDRHEVRVEYANLDGRVSRQVRSAEVAVACGSGPTADASIVERVERWFGIMPPTLVAPAVSPPIAIASLRSVFLDNVVGKSQAISRGLDDRLKQSSVATIPIKANRAVTCDKSKDQHLKQVPAKRTRESETFSPKKMAKPEIIILDD